MAPLEIFVGVEVTPLVAGLVRIGVELDVDALGLEAKYAELVVSSSLGAGSCFFFLGVAALLGLTSSSSSSSSETTLRARDFFSDFLGGYN